VGKRPRYRLNQGGQPKSESEHYIFKQQHSRLELAKLIDFTKKNP